MDAIDTATLTMRIMNLFILVFFVVLLFTVFLPHKISEISRRIRENPECDPTLERQRVIGMRVSNEGCSVWILPQLVAPKRGSEYGASIWETITQTEQTVNVPSYVRGYVSCLLTRGCASYSAPEENTTFQ